MKPTSPPGDDTGENSNRVEILDKKTKAEIELLTRTWRDHPSFNRTIMFRSWQLQDGAAIQSLVTNKITQQYLCQTNEIAEHLKKRLRVVRDAHSVGILRHPDGADFPNCKLLLLNPDTPLMEELPTAAQELVKEMAVDGPDVPLHFTFKDFKPSYLLQTILPVPPPTSFETIGHVAHFNLRSIHVPYRFLIGEIFVESIPAIETVIHKVGEVSGPHRTYDFELLAGRDDLHVQVNESGIALQFDLADVYWSSRLSEERARLLRDEVLKQPQDPRQQPSNIVLADVFCGVGALCLQAAAATSRVTVWANDWNPKAIEFLKRNAARQGLKVQTHCGDAYHYLIDLGMEGKRLPDHVVLNFPLEAPRFLGALRWWPPSATTSTRFHVYTFIGRDGVNPVPDALVWGRTLEDFDTEYGCEVVVHEVRDVAPGKRVVCVSFTATNRLLKHMQGDFD